MNDNKQYQKKKRKEPKQAKTAERVLNYAIWRLGEYGETSEKNLREKLARITDNQEWMDAAIARVIDLGYQSDRRYAEMIVRKGLGSEAWGERRIVEELKKKGIAPDATEQALELLAEDDPVGRAKEVLDKKFRDRKIEGKREWAKAQGLLNRKGFGLDAISPAINLHNEEAPEKEPVSKEVLIEQAREVLYKKFKGREIKERKHWAQANRFLVNKDFDFDIVSPAIKLYNEQVSEEE